MGILGTAASPGNMGRWEQRMKSPGRFQNYFYCDICWSRGGSPAPAQCNVWKSEKCIGDSDNWGAIVGRGDLVTASPDHEAQDAHRNKI